MLKINIKPSTVVEKKPRKSSPVLIVICIIIIFLTSITSIGIFVGNLMLNNKIKNVENNIETLKTENNIILALDKKNEKVQKKLKEVNDLKTKRINWTDLLNQITAKKPADLQITEFACYSEKGKEKGTLAGMSLSISSIMQFRNDLEKTNYFSSMDFESADRQTDNSFDFKMVFNLKLK